MLFQCPISQGYLMDTNCYVDPCQDCPLKVSEILPKVVKNLLMKISENSDMKPKANE